MKNFFLVLSHYNFIQIKVKTKKSMTLQSFNIRGWKWLSAYLIVKVVSFKLYLEIIKYFAQKEKELMVK